MGTHKILYILNPKAGHGINNDLKTLIQENTDIRYFDLQIKDTEYAGHASLLTREAVENGYSVVVSVGGDGTVNEVAKELAHTSTRLAIIPTGSGNGLARHLKIPIKANEAIKIINNNKELLIDTFVVNKQFACNVAGVGFDAFVAHQFSQGKNRGFKNYVKCVIQSYANFKSFQINSKIENIPKSAWMLSIANSSQFGNNATIAPHATITDGQLDITICQQIPVVEIPSFAYRLFFNKLKLSRYVQFIKIVEGEFNFPYPIPLHIDGEFAGETSAIQIKIAPLSLKVIVPND
jgi:YegS/Rv2252/BmrU family lipid kinase